MDSTERAVEDPVGESSAASAPLNTKANTTNESKTSEVHSSTPKASAPGADPIAQATIIEETIVKHSPTRMSGTLETPPTPLQQTEKAPPIDPARAATSPGDAQSTLPPSTTHAATASQNTMSQVSAKSVTEFEKEREVISRILEEAKLPERRQVGGVIQATSQHRGAPVDIQPEASSKSRDKEATAGATPFPIPEVITSKEEPGENKSFGSAIIAPLRTFKDDLREIVRKKKISLVRATALESDKRSRSNILGGEVVRSRSRRTRGVIFAATILFLLAGAALFGVYATMRGNQGRVPEAGNAILFTENAGTFPISNAAPLEVKRLLAQIRGSSNTTLGSITQIIPTVSETNNEGVTGERPATLEEFFSALSARVPTDLVRALSSEFFFGLHTVDENAPILIIPVTSYERAFAGMLGWEQTMNADLTPIFTSVPDQIMGPGGLPEKRRFEDVVMRNYDVRALKDDTNVIQLYYSFPTQHILVIGESPYSFNEVLSRLRADRKL